MLKKAFLLVVTLFIIASAKAQTAEDVYNSYLDFNLARLEGLTVNALEMGEEILPNAAKLTDKARISFYYSLGNLYENDNQSGKALTYYEKVAEAVPDYYVVQRALGYLHMKKVEEIGTQLNAARSNAAENKRLTGLYNAAATEALFHLEKAQACDPNDDTLKLIKMLYKNTKNENGLNSLNNRLAAMSKNCIDILTDK